MKQQMVENLVDSNIAVQIRGLVKIYPGKTKISCCKCKRTSPYHVLKVSNMDIFLCYLHFYGQP